MTDFHTLPVDEAITWIRAWTDHTWPMSLEEAYAVRDKLGWAPLPDEPNFFTTSLSRDGGWGGFISETSDDDIRKGLKFLPGADNRGINGVRFYLSPIDPSGDETHIAPLSRAAHAQYVSALTELWGPGKTATNDGDPEAHWKLQNGVSVSIFGLSRLISVVIESPWLTRITEEYDQWVEETEEND